MLTPIPEEDISLSDESVLGDDQDIDQYVVHELDIRMGAGNDGEDGNSNNTGEEERKPNGCRKQRESDRECDGESFFSRMAHMFKACGLLCAIGCPPLPEIITRKIAFHPPVPCGYSVHLDADPSKAVTKIRQLEGASFTIRPAPIKGLTRGDYSGILGNATPFTVRTSEGSTLIAVHMRTTKTPRSDALAKQVIIFAQPNGSDLGAFLHPHCVNLSAIADWMHMDVYAFDYSGYGMSSGEPSEKNLYADIEAVYTHVHAAHPDKKIVLLGYSIGTSAVTDFASLDPPNLSGVILIAPFTSGFRLMTGAPEQMTTCCLDRFRSADKIADIAVPVLLIHGSDDVVITVDHSLELHKRLRHPVTPLIVHGADHQTIFNGQTMQPFTRILRFLRYETFMEEQKKSLASSSES